MYISWNWLGRHVDLAGIDALEVVDRVTMSVAEVEGAEQLGGDLKGVVAGRVLETSVHPNADKLKIARVTTGDASYDVVCGAPNCEVGGVYPLALPGAMLPMGEVKKVALRGVDSIGMLCSEKDLGLTEDHGGLMSLDPAAALGTNLDALLPLKDVIFEIDNKSITHRPDLWGHIGLAREIAVLTGRAFEPHRWDLAFDAGPRVAVANQAPRLCPRYTAARYSGVTIAPSPLWLRILLERVGVRAISNVVDITNFVMMDVGNPIHAFDARFLKGESIIIRQAKPREQLTTLDGVDRALSTEDLLIADGERGVALAGVMGGENSEIRADTSEVVLEAANFHAATVRRTSTRLGIRTESSARFEKSLDPAFAVDAQRAFGGMLCEIIPGARVASGLTDDDHSAPGGAASDASKKIRVAIPGGLIERRLGTALPDGFTTRILSGLGFGVTEQASGALEVEVPSWRATKDVAGKEDIVEEVGRFFGYDNIHPEAPSVQLERPTFRRQSEARWTVARALALDSGLHQVQTYSFFSNQVMDHLGTPADDAEHIRVQNPISSDMTHMRSSLLPNLLMALQHNIHSHNHPDVRLFEIGRVFKKGRDAEGLPEQPQRVAIAWWHRDGDDELYFHGKGALETVLARLRIDTATWRSGAASAPPWLHPSKSAALVLGGDGQVEVGFVGLLHPRAAEAMKLAAVSGHSGQATGATVVAEIDMGALCDAWSDTWTVAPLERYPGVRYEISPIVPLAVTNQEMSTEIHAALPELLRSLRFLVEYHEAPIPEGEKSVSYELIFGRDDRTLTDDEAQIAAETVMARLKDRFGAYLREI